MRTFLFSIMLLSCVSPSKKPNATVIKETSPPAVSLQASYLQVQPLWLDERHARFSGIFINERKKKSYPVVLDLLKNPQIRQHKHRYHGVLRIFTAVSQASIPQDDRSQHGSKHQSYQQLSSFIKEIVWEDNQLVFVNSDKQSIRIVEAGTLSATGDMHLYAVAYGFGQGKLVLRASPAQINQVHRGVPSHYDKGKSRGSASPYPMAIENFALAFHPFPPWLQGENDEVREHSLLMDSKRLLSGDRSYYGVLHHEYMGRFQYVRLVFSEQEGKLLANSTLYFALPSKREFIVNRYWLDKGSYEVSGTVLSGEGDTLLLVENWHHHHLEGIWYSKTHGRIGKYYFQAHAFPKLAKNAMLVRSLTGMHKKGEHEYRLRVENRVSEKRELYPASVSGVVKDGTTQRRHPVDRVTYDFYRGIAHVHYGKGFRERLELHEAVR